MTRARIAPIWLVTTALTVAAASHASAEPAKTGEAAKSAVSRKVRPEAPVARDAKAKAAVGKDATGGNATRPARAKAETTKSSAKTSTRAIPARDVPMPRARPDAQESPILATPARKPAMLFATAAADGAGLPLGEAAPRANAPMAYAPTAAPTDTDIDALKDALVLVRKGKQGEAAERAGAIRDRTARKLVEWMTLRSDEAEATFQRYTDFIDASPGWPGIVTLRRRAEGQLWQEKRDPATVAAFFATTKPLSARGKLAMARALIARGDRDGAQEYVQDAWRQDDMSEDLEEQVLASFGALLTREDHKARMDARLYAEDIDDGLRAAARLGGGHVVVARARAAVARKAANAGALLEQVPSEMRRDTGYLFARAQWLRRNDRTAEAAQSVMAASTDPDEVVDTNEWWAERRLIARKLLDEDNPQAAYRIARDAAVPTKENSRVEHHFTAGWIALRFLGDAASAQKHFARIAEGARNPISLARGAYWQGRAAEAAGRTSEAQQHYQAAARFQTAYYGQLARARLGHGDVSVRRPPDMAEGQRASLRNLEIVRAVEALYAAGERDLVIPFVSDVADKATDIGALAILAEVASKNGDARATLHIGKAALARGYALDHYAFPSGGIPKYAALAQSADRSVVFAIARQESMFNSRAISTAKAMGLMQIMPGTGRLIAKKNGVGFDHKRLLNDPSYNAQFGAAELGDLLQAYDGNYALVFVGYNAGRGRVRQWVERYGDPRDPSVDPVDWVERIPFSETRNYVQRVMENMQVYKSRFAGGASLTIEADLRGSRGQ